VPYDEQCRIARRLSGLKILCDAESARLEKFRCLKLGLMNDLLTSRVRVKVAEPKKVPA
jgi:hypothetical protein